MNWEYDAMTSPVSGRKQIVVVSDIHHAGEMERQRHGYEWKAIDSFWLRTIARGYFHFIWLREPLAHSGPLMDRFLECTPSPDLVVANGDFTIDTAFVGVSD